MKLQPPAFNFFSLQGKIEKKCIHLAKHFVILLSNMYCYLKFNQSAILFFDFSDRLKLLIPQQLFYSLGS